MVPPYALCPMTQSSLFYAPWAHGKYLHAQPWPGTRPCCKLNLFLGKDQLNRPLGRYLCLLWHTWMEFNYRYTIPLIPKSFSPNYFFTSSHVECSQGITWMAGLLEGHNEEIKWSLALTFDWLTFNWSTIKHHFVPLPLPGNFRSWAQCIRLSFPCHFCVIN